MLHLVCCLYYSISDARSYKYQILIYLIIHTCFFIYALLMLSNPLNMIKIDRNISELWQIVCKNIFNFKFRAFFGFTVWIVYQCTDLLNVKIIILVKLWACSEQETVFNDLKMIIQQWTWCRHIYCTCKGDEIKEILYEQTGTE